MAVMKRQSEDLLLLFTTTTLLVFLQIIVGVEAKVHYHDFILREKNFTRVCHTKSMLVVNEQFPGPTLYVRKGDTMFVNVQNKGSSGVTLHWHGVNQPRNPWSDGPEYITQCPIEPGMNFTYEVIFSVEEGTLWWHAHNEWTRNTVHGAIVIYPVEGSSTPYATPFGEQVLILGSWYDYDVNIAVDNDFKTAEDMPTSTQYLINGLPGNFVGCSQEDTFHWDVDYNKTYLLRIVSAVMNAEMFFSIARHNLTVVGTDGHYLKPFDTGFIMISPGQTIDVLVTTNQSSSGMYYMMTTQFISALATDYDIDMTNATAILGYNNTTKRRDDGVIIFPDTLPSHTDSSAAYGFVRKFKSLASDDYPIDVPINITTNMFIVVSMSWIPFYPDANESKLALCASLNNISWVNPKTDILQAYYRNMSGVYTEDFPDQPSTYYNYTGDTTDVNYIGVTGTKVKMLNYNEQVEIVFQGTDLRSSAGDHPMHLHGHSFYRVGFGTGNFDPLSDPVSYNLIDPPAGNTFTVPTDGWIAIRYKANNPGVWLWHCHFDKHLSWGMNTVFITRDGGTPESTMRDAPSNMPSCNSSLISSGSPTLDISF